ncbi:MAG: M2 family metallopeptidase [Actinomycetota bacterium]|nr:M2 family metallopeptidase [Actinomycetota bacterium]
MNQIESFITSFEERLAPVEKASSEAWWNLATSGTEEAQKELVRAGMAYNELFADRGEYEMVRGWYEDRGSLESSILRRQVEILYKTFAGRQGDGETLRRIEELEAEANAIYSNHRGIIEGAGVNENELREILRVSDDPALRREAWEASKSVGRKVEGIVRELARLRNRLARAEGFADHHARSLDLQEIDAVELARLMDDLQAASDEPFREFKEGLDADLKMRFGIEEVMPWHLSDPFFQSCKHDLSAFPRSAPRRESGGTLGEGATGLTSDEYSNATATPELDIDGFFLDKNLEALTRKTYDNMGLEVRDVLAKSDLYERAGKDQHAFCLRVGRSYPYDVRVLANVRSDSYWMDTMLHEFGHAVYDKYINPNLPYLLRTIAHINSTEAIALMMGSLADDPAWLSAVARVPEEDLERYGERLLWIGRADRLVFVRWALVMYRFEKVLYEDPDRGDLNDLWWDLVEQVQLAQRPPGRDEPDWAAKLHVALAPVYYHNYVLGYLTAAQLRHHLEKYVVVGPFFTSELAGRYLQEAVFSQGARDDWEDTVLRATGERLNPDYFVKSLL